MPVGGLTAKWRKSTRSNTQGACVEVRLVDGVVEVRDTKAGPTGPVLPFAADEWVALLINVKAGQLDG